MLAEEAVDGGLRNHEHVNDDGIAQQAWKTHPLELIEALTPAETQLENVQRPARLQGELLRARVVDTVVG